MFFKLFVFKPKNIHVEQKHNLKSEKKNKDKEKGFEIKNKTENPPKKKILMKK